MTTSSPTLKRYIISALNTFIATFIVTLATLISAVDVADSASITAALMSAAVTWVRTTLKLLIEK